MALIAENLAGVRHRILILSGKGGVGKSTVTAHLTRTLARDGEFSVGVLDVDICGPSQPQMMGVMGGTLHGSQFGMTPVITGEHGNVSVVSVGFLLSSDSDAVIWRGPKKNALIKQFLRDIQWDQLDYLLVDTPPGTSDEHLALAQLISPISGAILVTTPQEVAWQDVRKEIDFCRKTHIPIIGLVVNMAGFVCGACGKGSEVFGVTRIREYAAEKGIPILSTIPLDSSVGISCDDGLDLPPSVSSYYDQLANNLIEILNNK